MGEERTELRVYFCRCKRCVRTEEGRPRRNWVRFSWFEDYRIFLEVTGTTVPIKNSLLVTNSTSYEPSSPILSLFLTLGVRLTCVWEDELLEQEISFSSSMGDEPIWENSRSLSTQGRLFHRRSVKLSYKN